MRSVAFRFFWTDHGAVIDELKRMEQFREHCHRQAALLAESVGAESAAFDNTGRLVAFAFSFQPHKRDFEPCSEKNANGLQLYRPVTKGLVGIRCDKERRKFQLPLPNQALGSTPFTRTVKLPTGERWRAQLKWLPEMERAYAVVPYHLLSTIEASDWSPITPCPPDWVEISENEYLLFVENADKQIGACRVYH